MNLSVQIGSHTDQLWHLESWKRLPQLVRRFPVKAAQTTAANGSGGLVYCDVPEGAAAARIPVTIKNAVEAPFYRLGATMHEDSRRAESASSPLPGPSCWART